MAGTRQCPLRSHCARELAICAAADQMWGEGGVYKAERKHSEQIDWRQPIHGKRISRRLRTQPVDQPFFSGLPLQPANDSLAPPAGTSQRREPSSTEETSTWNTRHRTT